MKKYLAVLLAVMMVLSLAACGKTEEATTASTTTVTESTKEFKPTYKTLNVMVPFAAGGTVDLYSRLVSKYAPKYTDINLVITNMAGSSGSIGAMEVLSHDADGSWMMATAPSTSWISTADRKLPYTMEDDWVAVSALYSTSNVLLIKSGNKNFSDLDSFIKYAKANPGKVNIGLSGASGNPYYYAAMTNETYEIETKSIAFDGESDALTNLLGGHVDAIVISEGIAKTQESNGEAKAIITFAGTRSPKLPDVPCMKELGYKYILDANRGFVMKKGTDEKILKYWSDVMEKMCADPDFIKESESIGLNILYMNTEEATQAYYDAIKGIEEVAKAYK